MVPTFSRFDDLEVHIRVLLLQQLPAEQRAHPFRALILTIPQAHQDGRISPLDALEDVPDGPFGESSEVDLLDSRGKAPSDPVKQPSVFSR